MTKKELNRIAIIKINHLVSTTYEYFENEYKEVCEWFYINQDNLDAYCEMRNLLSEIKYQKHLAELKQKADKVNEIILDVMKG